MKRGWIILIVVLGLFALYVAWYLVSPLFIDNVVDEALPGDDSSEVSDLNVLTTGNFIDADSAHKVSGTANIISEGEKTYLRFENFEATNGPDLKVYFSKDLNAQEYVSLGDLKGNIGNQNYEITDLEYEEYSYVLIWCEAFSVLFGSAELDENS